MNNITDAINRYQRGDDAAFEVIYKESYATVKAACLSVTGSGNPIQLEDLVQESYLRIIKGIYSYDSAKANFLTWAGKVAVNTAISNLRKKNIEMVPMIQETESEEIILDFADEKIDYQPDLQYEAAEREKLIRDILQELSDRQRECIVLFYMNQMKIAEIADALDMQENAVKVNLHRGRKKVEERVTSMEKQGIKLLGLAPIVFFTSLLMSEKEAYAKESVASFVKNGMCKQNFRKEMPGGKEKVQQELPGVDKGKVADADFARGVTKKAGMSIAKKVIIGLVAVSVAVGGGYVVGHQKADANNKETSADEKKDENKKKVRVIDKKDKKKAEEAKTEVLPEEQQAETEAVNEEQEAENARVDAERQYIQTMADQHYSGLIEAYQRQETQGFVSGPMEMNSLLYDGTFQGNLYYTIIDMAGDGTPELFFADESGLIYDAWGVLEGNGQWLPLMPRTRGEDSAPMGGGKYQVRLSINHTIRAEILYVRDGGVRLEKWEVPAHYKEAQSKFANLKIAPGYYSIEDIFNAPDDQSEFYKITLTNQATPIVADPSDAETWYERDNELTVDSSIVWVPVAEYRNGGQ